MPEHQGIDKGAKIAKKNIFDFLSFWSGLIYNIIPNMTIFYHLSTIIANFNTLDFRTASIIFVLVVSPLSIAMLLCVHVKLGNRKDCP